MRELERAVQGRDNLLDVLAAPTPPPGTDLASTRAQLEQSRSEVARLSSQTQQLQDLIAAESAAIGSTVRLESLAMEAETLANAMTNQIPSASTEELEVRLSQRQREFQDERSFFLNATQSGLVRPDRTGVHAGGDSLGFILGQLVGREGGPSRLPALLPWPPPTASGTVVLPRDIVRSRMRGDLRLSVVDMQIRRALSRSGYQDVAYYGVPGGFAIATRLERINEDGVALGGTARWSTNLPPLREFTLQRYLGALFAAEPGYFRVFVIIVSDRPFRPDPSRARFAQIVNWSNSGLNVLPSQVGRDPLTPAHDVTILVYEFSKTRGARTGQAIIPGRWSAGDHLQRSRLRTAFFGG